MKNRAIIEKLQNLQSLRVGGDSNPVWQRNLRDELTSVARHDLENTPAPSWLREEFDFAKILMPYRISHYVLRPIAVSGLVLVVALGGWATTVSASYNSLPGDTLYGVKLATEQAQITLAGSTETKVQLTVEFAGRRAEDMAKIIEKPAPAQEKARRVKVAASSMKNNLTEVQNKISNITEQGKDPAKAVLVAKLVERKAEELNATLTKTAEKASGDAREAVKEAKDAAVDAGVAAVAVMVKAHEVSNELVSEAEAKEKVIGKIASLREEVDRVEKATDGAATEKTIQAKEVAEQATELVTQNNLGGALTKVIEGNEIAKEADAFAAATKDSAPPADASATSTPAALPAATSTLRSAPLPPFAGTSTGPLPGTVVSSTVMKP